MSYGIVKLDRIVYTSGGLDANILVSGFVSAVSGVVSGLFPSGTAAAPSVTVGTSSNGLYSPGTDQVAISTSGTERFRFDSTGQLESVSLGTAAAPVFSFTTDPNTGIYSPGADQLAISTNGAGRLFVDSSGRVGIGTTSPAGALNVVTGTAGDPSLTYNTSNIANFNYGAIQLALGVNSAAPFGAFLQARDNANSSRVISLNPSGGNVGIGTTSPSYLLHLNGTSNVESRAVTSGASSTAQWGAQNTTGATVVIGAAGSSYSPYGVIGAGNAYVYTGSDLAIATDGANVIKFATGAGISERARIDSSGRLLVGTTTAINDAHTFTRSVNNNAFVITNGATSGVVYGLQIRYTGSDPNSSGSAYLECFNSFSSNIRAEIRSNGGLANYQANNVNLSDRNAKKDISLAADTWDCIKEWEIVNYRYKDQLDDADLNLGVIAQQVAESCPEVITVFEEAKDDQPEKLGIKEQQMYWMAIKALQEAQVRIEALEAEVAALKAQ